jgi:hypothetical protein
METLLLMKLLYLMGILLPLAMLIFGALYKIMTS